MFSNDPDRDEAFEKLPVKTAEEIAQLEIDESLNEYERVSFIFKRGQDMQFVSAINTLPCLFERSAETQEELLKTLVSGLARMGAGSESQQAAADLLPTLIAEKMIPLSLFVKHLFPLINTGLKLNVDVWLTCLLTLIPSLDSTTVKSCVLPIVHQRSSISQNSQSRISACHILSTLAPIYNANDVIVDVMPLVCSLCQDIDSEVRCVMCDNLQPFAEKLGIDETVKNILPELIELSNDEESVVKYTALSGLVGIIPYVDQETVQSTIVLTIDKYLDTMNFDKEVGIMEIAAIYGQMCIGLADYIDDEKRRYYTSRFTKLCSVGLSGNHDKVTGPFLPPIFGQQIDKCEECRRAAAYNYPAMIMFSNPKFFTSELHTSFHNLCTDPSAKVRMTIARSFHEVSRLLDPFSNVIQPEFISLLKDSDLQVLEPLVANLKDTLFFQIQSTAQEDNAAIISALLDCYATIAKSNHWRLSENFLHHVSSFHKWFSSDAIHSHFYPVVLETLKSHCSVPVRDASCQVIANMLRYNTRVEHRNEISGMLIKEFCRGQSCHNRIIFINMAQHLINQFSRAYFKENFFYATLELCADRTLDVRLRIAKLLPTLKSLLKLPTDRLLLQRLEFGVRKLLNFEKENCVNALIREFVHIFDQQEVAIDSVTNRSGISAADVEDAAKEDEEKSILASDHGRRRRPTVGTVKSGNNSTSNGQSQNNVPRTRGSITPTPIIQTTKQSTVSSNRNQPAASNMSTQKNEIRRKSLPVLNVPANNSPVTGKVHKQQVEPRSSSVQATPIIKSNKKL